MVKRWRYSQNIQCFHAVKIFSTLISMENSVFHSPANYLKIHSKKYK